MTDALSYLSWTTWRCYEQQNCPEAKTMFLNADQLNIWTLQTFKLWVRKECDYGLKKKERRKSID